MQITSSGIATSADGITSAYLTLGRRRLKRRIEGIKSHPSARLAPTPGCTLRVTTASSHTSPSAIELVRARRMMRLANAASLVSSTGSAAIASETIDAIGCYALAGSASAKEAASAKDWRRARLIDPAQSVPRLFEFFLDICSSVVLKISGAHSQFDETAFPGQVRARAIRVRLGNHETSPKAAS